MNLSVEQREAVLELVESAAAGRCPWLRRGLRDLGFVPLHGATAAEVAALFGVSPATVARRGLPKGPRGYDLREVIRWRAEFATSGDDPEMSGPNSPALERWRTARAIAAERDNEEADKALIRRETIHELLGGIATVLRGACERLERDFGSEARAIYEEALADAARLAHESLYGE